MKADDVMIQVTSVVKRIATCTGGVSSLAVEDVSIYLKVSYYNSR